MYFRILNGVAAALFAFAVVVQYNDPDPLVWVGLYASACAICVAVAVRGVIPLIPAVAVGGIALGWALALAAGVPVAVYTDMFDAWEMKSASIEEARETSGLLIVAAWMATLYWMWRRGRAEFNRPGFNRHHDTHPPT